MVRKWTLEASEEALEVGPPESFARMGLQKQGGCIPVEQAMAFHRLTFPDLEKELACYGICWSLHV